VLFPVRYRTATVREPVLFPLRYRTATVREPVLFLESVLKPLNLLK
jgi:hypothetical protein